MIAENLFQAEAQTRDFSTKKNLPDDRADVGGRLRLLADRANPAGGRVDRVDGDQVPGPVDGAGGAPQRGELGAELGRVKTSRASRQRENE